MNLNCILRAGAPTVLVLLATTAAALSAQITNTINVMEPRPLSAALDALEKSVGIPVNYEDPPYENEADLQDVSTKEQRAAVPGYRLLVPRPGRVVATVQMSGATNQIESDVIFNVNLLLASYRQSQMPGDFKVDQINRAIYVTPVKILGADGTMREVTSPMTSVVTVPYAKRTVTETAQAIFSAVYSATGSKIVIGMFPFWPSDVISFGVNGEPARDALARLFTEAGKGPMSYRLTFDPKPDLMRVFDYMINVHPAAYAPPVGPVVPVPATKASGASSGLPSSPQIGVFPGFARPKP